MATRAHGGLVHAVRHPQVRQLPLADRRLRLLLVAAARLAGPAVELRQLPFALRAVHAPVGHDQRRRSSLPGALGVRKGVRVVPATAPG